MSKKQPDCDHPFVFVMPIVRTDTGDVMPVQHCVCVECAYRYLRDLDGNEAPGFKMMGFLEARKR